MSLCLGYEDLNDHDQLRSDPMLAVMVGETDPKGRTRKQARDRGKALAGKSTLNRLELSTEGAADHPYKKIGRDEAAMDRLMVDVFLQAHRRAPRQIILDLDATDDRFTGVRRVASFTAITGTIVICRCISSVGSFCCVPGYDDPTSMVRPDRSKSWNGSSDRFGRSGPESRS